MPLTQTEILDTTVPVQNGLFRISRSGRVYSRNYPRPNIWKEYKVLTLTQNGYSRQTVTVTINKKQVRFSVHRLMAEAFVVNPDPETHTYVLAADKNILNIDPENLYWATPDMFYHYTFAQKLKLQSQHTKQCADCGTRFRKNIDTTNYCPKCHRRHQTIPHSPKCGFCDGNYKRHTGKPCCSDCYKQYSLKAARLSDYHYMYTHIIDLHQLTDFERQCITMRLEDKTQPEMAHILNVSTQRIKQTFAKIHKKRKDHAS